jgi:uncharacterized protein YcbX
MSDCTGKIQKLFIYPIKSCAGIEVEQAELKPTGLAMDREWVIVDQNGQFLTQRQIPHTVWIKPTLSDTMLTLACPTQASIDLPLDFRGKTLQATVWRDTILSEDMGDEVAAWLDRFLQIPGRHFRLLALVDNLNAYPARTGRRVLKPLTCLATAMPFWW